MLYRKKKKNKSPIADFRNFHIQIKYDCEGNEDTLFFEMENPIDEPLLEYLKPFGEIIPVSGSIYELTRENFFQIKIPIGRTSLIVKLTENHDISAKTLLINQLKLGLKETPLSPDLPEKCPEDAINIYDGALKIDRKKCTFCLDCVEKEGS
ncbi:hypothetical protein ACFL6G_04320 [candidate division KSB1 bacterium]